MGLLHGAPRLVMTIVRRALDWVVRKESCRARRAAVPQVAVWSGGDPPNATKSGTELGGVALVSAPMSGGVALLAESVTPRICPRMVPSGDLAVSSL